MVIDLLDDIEVIIRKVLACEYVISTSLHGLIIAHAYGIPALWYEYREVEWHGSDVKFFDYFSSVGITEYVPFQMPDKSRFSLKDILDRFKQADGQGLVQVKLSVLQKQLLDVAPFPVDRWHGSIVNESVSESTDRPLV